MVSPQPDRFAITPALSDKVGQLGGSSRVLQARASNSRSPLSDETLWKRLSDAGFDEDSIKRRDKAALIAYIAKLEAEIFDYQHHMGLLILERKQWASKYEEIKASAESAEIMYKHEQAEKSSTFAEATKREVSLKKALGVEQECIANLEKALHETRLESAEVKVDAEIKLTEAKKMVEDAQVKLIEAETKVRLGESMQEEASRYHRAAERKLKEVEDREDDLRRRISSFKSECDAKEKAIDLERQSVYERQKTLQQEQERLLDGQSLLNDREEHILGRSQELHRLEKQLEVSKGNLDKEVRALNVEKSNLELNMASLQIREENVIKREAILNKKEKELLVLQQKCASKENDENKKITDDRETALNIRKSEFDAELETRRKLVEDEIQAKRRAWELREMDLCNREYSIAEKEQDLENQSRKFSEVEKDVIDRASFLEEKERILDNAEKEIESKKMHLQKEMEVINNKKVDLQKALDSLESRREQVNQAEEKLKSLKNDTNELLVLETKLKEEIEMVQAQKDELLKEADELKSQKSKFEAEWEMIDEKRLELRREAASVAEERVAVSKYLKDERDALKLEKDSMRAQHKLDVESLNREREEFMNKMKCEYSELFSKIQQERADLFLDIEMQKRELESCIDNRKKELEHQFREKERVFEDERVRELEYINSLKLGVEKEIENVALERKRLDSERMEINLDHERREKEWKELNDSIRQLENQREKLKEQRELLHKDREEILSHIEDLKKLEDLKVISGKIIMQEESDMIISRRKVSAEKVLLDSRQIVETKQGQDTPSSASLSWMKRCTDLIFRKTPEKYLDSSDGFEGRIFKGTEMAYRNPSGREPVRYALEEPKVILEVPSEERGRKRRSKVSDSHEQYDHLLDPAENNKRRRQKIECTVKRLEETTTTHCVVSTQSDVLEDLTAIAHGVTKETDVEVDTIELISENVDAGNTLTHGQLECLQNSVAELEEETYGTGGSNGYLDPHHGPTAQKITPEEFLVDGDHCTDYDQHEQEVLLGGIDQKH